MKNFKLVFLIVFLAIPLFLFAHSPSEISLQYEKEKETLEVKVNHSVRNADRHYIENIIITINDNEYEVLEYDSQTSENSHDVKTKIPDLSPGDIIKVKAECSRIGSDTKELTIE